MRLHSVPVLLSALVLSTALLFAQSAKALEPGPVTPEVGKAIIQEKKDLVIIDVRNPDEHAVAHYPNALNIPVDELEARISEVPAGKPVLVHCGTGKRGQRAYELLKAKRPDIKELYCISGNTIF